MGALPRHRYFMLDLDRRLDFNQGVVSRLGVPPLRLPIPETRALDLLDTSMHV
jgi:hypothetical protein